jgi:hypothetical protein
VWTPTAPPENRTAAVDVSTWSMELPHARRFLDACKVVVGSATSEPSLLFSKSGHADVCDRVEASQFASPQPSRWMDGNKCACRAGVCCVLCASLRNAVRRCRVPLSSAGIRAWVSSPDAARRCAVSPHTPSLSLSIFSLLVCVSARCAAAQRGSKSSSSSVVLLVRCCGMACHVHCSVIARSDAYHCVVLLSVSRRHCMQTSDVLMRFLSSKLRFHSDTAEFQKYWSTRPDAIKCRVAARWIMPHLLPVTQ